MNFKYLTLLLLILIINGCDTLNHRQYFVITAISPIEIEYLKKEVEKSLTPLVHKYDLKKTDKARPGINVIVSYVTKSNFPIQVGMRELDGVVVLDLMHFHPGTEETVEYQRIVNDVLRTLKDTGNFKLIENGHLLSL